MTALRTTPGELLRSLPLTKKPEDYDGGLTVSKRLKDLLNIPGYLKSLSGGEEARGMYVQGTMTLNPMRLSPFGLLCYLGAFEAVFRAVETNIAPPLSSTETPYKLSYTTILLFGAQRIIRNIPGALHLETLQYLIAKKLPLDTPDIAGWTTLSHAAGAPRARPALTKALVDGGANLNHRSRFGDVPMIGAFMRNNVKDADLSLEGGADLDIPDGDGITPREFFIKAGPQITALVQKHIVMRSGKAEAPRTEKSCDCCRKTGVPLRNCSRCQVARYCSVDCQKNAWTSHKKTCQPFSTANTLAFKPYYTDNSLIGFYSNAALARTTLGGPQEPVSDRQTRSAHIPKDVAQGRSKNIIVKVQVSMEGPGPMLVYDKKRDFVCQIRRVDSPANYDRLDALIREKGVFGLKAYFAAELKAKDELVIKVSEVLAEQPF